MGGDTSFNIVIGGEAGQGLATIGLLFTKALVRSGYWVNVYQDYMSRVRGGHNTYRIRMDTEPVYAPKEEIDVLVALNQETVSKHAEQVSTRGVVVLDEEGDPAGIKAFRVPFKKLADKKIFYNTVALGVLGATLCGDRKIFEDLLRETFSKKGEQVVQSNLDVLRRSYEWHQEQEDAFECPAPSEKKEGRLCMSGNEAIAMGALAAGCNFCSFYPMTPSTSVALNLIGKGGELGLVSEQAEDEISALNMALGASYAGARALVPTSGGGFALMNEAFSLAGMTEMPVVVVLAQRPGPATGLPTRTEQGDLLFSLHAGHGEFPRVLLAPGSVEQCFHLAHRSFDLTEKFQVPVILLTDQYLADCYNAVSPFDLNSLDQVARPLLEVDNPGEYRRYEWSDTGVSSRVIPGFSEALVVVDSDEHTPDGHITEDHSVRTRMVEKRNRKLKGLLSEVIPPEYEGDSNPEILLVCWGSSRGPVRETVTLLNQLGKKAAMIHFAQVWPLDPDNFLSLLEKAEKVVSIEGNFSGQFAGLLRKETGFSVDGQIHRYDGLPFTSRYLLEKIEQLS